MKSEKLIKTKIPKFKDLPKHWREIYIYLRGFKEANIKLLFKWGLPISVKGKLNSLDKRTGWEPHTRDLMGPEQALYMIPKDFEATMGRKYFGNVYLEIRDGMISKIFFDESDFHLEIISKREERKLRLDF